MMILAEDGLLAHVVERVVHPAHVPFHAETEAAQIHRARHHRPRRRLLGDHLRVRMIAVHRLVQMPQELDRAQVFLAAVRVGDPLARLAPVVEIEHRRDGVHAQAVDVVLVEPEHRARQQESAHLMAIVVEDRAVPLGMKALARIGVLVEVGPVEIREAVSVGGKMRRHPVEDHADPLTMQHVDEVHEVLRRPVACGGREVPGRLVAPRAVERVLGDRHQLDVREAVVADVVGQAAARCPDTSASGSPSRRHEPRWTS